MVRERVEETLTNTVLAGLGGQGVLTAANILAHAAFAAGFDVKQSEIHGMSQRGGSVTSDIRFGRRVLSPMITPGEAHFLVVLAATEEERARHYLRPGGVLISAADFDADNLPHASTMGVMLLGALSRRLTIAERCWEDAIRAQAPARFLAQNLDAFRAGAKR